jgi:hypothetical protein
MPDTVTPSPAAMQLLSCKSLGMLRRIMIKHKATMEPEHVADTVLCLQHLVRAARAARRSGVRQSFPFAHHATSQARSQPRVRAAGEFSRSKLRGSESDGHMEQLMAQMLGELGSMIWFQVRPPDSCCWCRRHQHCSDAASAFPCSTVHRHACAAVGAISAASRR